MRQLDQATPGGIVEVPLDRCLHFRLEGKMGDPNGESLLRAAYEPWYGLKHADTWIGILIERMGGVPVIQATDPNIHLWDANNTDMVALRGYLEEAVTAFRLDEQMGAVIPSGFKFELLTPELKITDIENYIRLCSWRILGSILAQFLELGQAPRGSYGKSESDKEFFLLAEEAILQHVIAETINQQEVPRLFGMNAGSFSLEKLPELVPSDLQVPTLADLAEPLSKLVAASVLRAGPALEGHVREIGDLPEEEEEAGEPTEAMPAAPPQESGEEEPEELQTADKQHYVAADFL